MAPVTEITEIVRIGTKALREGCGELPNGCRHRSIENYTFGPCLSGS